MDIVIIILLILLNGLFAMSEVIGFRAVEIRAISNIVGDSFDKWAVDEAVMALAVELKKFDDEK